MDIEYMYDVIVKEHFDLSDMDTLRAMSTITENDREIVLDTLAEKLYNIIIDKVDDIDFGSIPSSNGDITLIENYIQLTDSINIMRELIIEFKQNPYHFDQLNECIENIKSRKSIFSKGFTSNNELVILIYNTMVLSIVSSVSYLITTCVEFVKGNDENYELVLDKVAYQKSKEYILLKNIEKFNKTCSSGDVDKLLNTSVNSSVKGLLGVDVAIGATGLLAVTVLLFSIIPILRECIYFFFYSRVRLADYFDIQANLLEMNALSLETKNLEKGDKTLSNEQKKEVIEKQKYIAQTFRKVSDFFRIKSKKSSSEVEKIIKSENNKNKINDLTDEHLDSLF